MSGTPSVRAPAASAITCSRRGSGFRSRPRFVPFFLADHLDVFGVNPEVVPEARAYLRMLAPSLVPALVFGAFRNYLQAVGGATGAMITLVLANAVNALLNYALVFGHWARRRWALRAQRSRP